MKNWLLLGLRARLTAAGLVQMTTAWAPAADLPGDSKSVPSILKEMDGNWAVEERMWPAGGQPAVQLAPATAHRHLIQNSFLEEVMEPVNAAAPDSFNRTSLLVFNTSAHKFEYFSLDTRLPQMMIERSAVVDPSAKLVAGINLQGGRFVAPTWGNAHNVPFTYRLVVGDVKGGRQTVRLFLTPESAKNRQEFLAFEYSYVKTP